MEGKVRVVLGEKKLLSLRHAHLNLKINKETTKKHIKLFFD